MATSILSQPSMCAQDDVGNIRVVLEEILESSVNQHILMLAQNQERMLSIILAEHPARPNYTETGEGPRYD